jgi:hypothetical protein
MRSRRPVILALLVGVLCLPGCGNVTEPAKFPDRVTDLAALGAGRHTIFLGWTLSLGDENSSPVTGYDVRYTTGALADSTWDSASHAVMSGYQVNHWPRMFLEIGGLQPQTRYQVALKAQDADGHWTSLSNVVEIVTAHGGWEPLGTGVDAEGRVVCAVADGGDLLVGGTFSYMGGAPATNVARWDGTAWRALGSGPAAPVTALGLFDGQPVAALSTECQSSLARWDGAAWQNIGAPWCYVEPTDITRFGFDLLVITHAYTRSRLSCVTCDNVTDYDLVEGDAGPLAVIDGQLFAGFARQRGESAWDWALVRWTDLGWEDIGGLLPAPASGIVQFAGTLVISAYGASAAGDVLLSWSGTQWLPWGGALDGPIRDLCSDGMALYAVWWDATNMLSFVVRWQGGAWEKLGPPFWRTAGGLALTAYDGTVVAVGDFRRFDGVSLNEVAIWRE